MTVTHRPTYYCKTYRNWDGRSLMDIGYDEDWNPVFIQDFESGTILYFYYA
jgi:hypothetical protein